MQIIIHRVNTTDFLKKIPEQYGVEVDIRHDNRTNRLYLNHDPGEGEDLELYLQNYNHAFIVFNIKEAGIEERCIELAHKYNISTLNYFLLDAEFPFIYRAVRKGVREIAMRYSEDEPIEQALVYRGKINWLWVDTNTRLPLFESVVGKLADFKICLVSPDRWGRPEDIYSYREQMNSFYFVPHAVMVGWEYKELWEK